MKDIDYSKEFGFSRDPKDFERLNLKHRNLPEVWEDGLRTDCSKGTYEWWYFDAHLENGATLVVIFYTKPLAPTSKAFSPFIGFKYEDKNGKVVEKQFHYKPEDFSASKEICDVKIGNNHFRGNLKSYEIFVKEDDVELDIKIENLTESWRPYTGFQYFDETKERYGSWVVAVPQGHAKAKIKLEGKDLSSQGSCYHDHNWGTVEMANEYNHWYWSRAEIGPYTMVCVDIIGEKQYDYDNALNFYLAKDGKTIADDRDKIEEFKSAPKIQKVLGKPLSDNIKYIYGTNKDERQYMVTLRRDHNIAEVDVIKKGGVNNPLLLKLIKMYMGKESAYYRVVGEARIEVFEKGTLIEEHVSELAVWECMYFGEPMGTE